MQKILFIVTISIISIFGACKNEFTSDASGTFEADEIIVSAEQTGRILQMNAKEGMDLDKNQIVGQIDVTSDKLKEAQIEASINSLNEKTNNPAEQLSLIKKQLAVQEAQHAQLNREKKRISNLLQADAATQKQLDDITASVEQLEKQILVTKQQISVTQSNIATQNRGILSEKAPLEKSVAQIKNLISKGQIICPIKGTVLTQYAFEGEMASVGKALFKIANIDTIYLKAYISGEQLPQIKLGQNVTVLIDQDKKSFKQYKGKISWISAKSEFTPKTIQTKDERANLVYAIKISVKNDGYLKIGMYGEVKF